MPHSPLMMMAGAAVRRKSLAKALSKVNNCSRLRQIFASRLAAYSQVQAREAIRAVRVAAAAPPLPSGE